MNSKINSSLTKILTNRFISKIAKSVLVTVVFYILYKTDQFEFGKLKNAGKRIDLFCYGFLFIFINTLIATQRWRVLLFSQEITMDYKSALKLTYLGVF